MFMRSRTFILGEGLMTSDYQSIGSTILSLFATKQAVFKYDISSKTVTLLIKSGLATLHCNRVTPTRRGCCFLRKTASELYGLPKSCHSN